MILQISQQSVQESYVTGYRSKHCSECRSVWWQYFTRRGLECIRWERWKYSQRQALSPSCAGCPLLRSDTPVLCWRTYSAQIWVSLSLVQTAQEADFQTAQKEKQITGFGERIMRVRFLLYFTAHSGLVAHNCARRAGMAPASLNRRKHCHSRGFNSLYSAMTRARHRHTGLGFLFPQGPEFSFAY